MDYDALFEAQEGKCAICEKEWKPTNWKGAPSRKMHRDHDHKTMQPRGLLCQACNRHLKDAFPKDWYLAAYLYLEKYA